MPELVAVHKPGHLNVVPDAPSRGLLAPWTTSFTLTACGMSHVCRVGRVRGRVQRLMLSAAAVGQCSPENGTVVGMLPSSGQIDTLRGLLALRMPWPLIILTFRGMMSSLIDM